MSFCSGFPFDLEDFEVCVSRPFVVSDGATLAEQIIADTFEEVGLD